MEEYIKQIIEQTKESLLKDVNPKYHEELINGYTQEIHRQFRGLKIKKEYYDEGLQYEVNLFNSLLTKESPWERLSRYIEDKAYEELSSLSTDGRNLGLKRYFEETITDKNITDTSIDKMTKLLANVRDFNKLKAQSTYEDGVLDYNYACGASNVFSLRMGHFIPPKKIKEEER